MRVSRGVACLADSGHAICKRSDVGRVLMQADRVRLAISGLCGFARQSAAFTISCLFSKNSKRWWHGSLLGFRIL